MCSSDLDLYLYPNTVRAVKMTGAQIREWLERSTLVFNRIDPAQTKPQPLINSLLPSYNFDVILGVTYRIDVTQQARYSTVGRVVDPSAHRILDLRYNGKPIDESASFVVATNNYRSGGGGSFPGLDGSSIIFESSDNNQEILKDWLTAQKTVSPTVTPTWSFAPIAVPVKVVFETSPSARQFLAGQQRIHDAGDGEKGFALFSIDLR